MLPTEDTEPVSQDVQCPQWFRSADMLTIYKTTDHGLETVDDIADGCWVHVITPGPEEISRLESLGVPPDFLTHAPDLDERPRTERDDGGLLIVLHFPYAQGPSADIPFITVPLSIILTENLIVTIAPLATGVMQKFAVGNVRGLSTAKKTRFVLHLLWHIANQYLVQLREINANVVLKFLASVTIILSVPTLIASLYGMNVDLPLDEHPLAFALILAVSVAISLIVVVVFWRKDWL